MTDRLTEIMDIIEDKLDVDPNYAAQSFTITGIATAARAIMALDAEMAGEWNAGLEAAAKLVEQAHDLEVETPLQTKVDAAFNARGPRASMAIRCYDSGRVIADAIRALRRPDAAPALPVETVTRETVESWLAYFDAHADEFAASHADLIARLTRPDTPSEAAAAARPVPQAGEVAASVPPDVVQRWRAQMSRPHVIIRDIQRLGTEMADLLTAQAAEIEFLQGHQEGDAESIAALTAIIADKNAEIAELQKVRDFAIAAHDGQVQDKDCIAGWLAARDARIVKLAAALRTVRAATYSKNRDCSLREDAVAAICDVARVALAPAGKEVKP